MPQRKGQFLVNYLRSEKNLSDVNIVRYLFGVRDEDFERIEQKYRQYVIEELHKPDRQARHEDLQMIADNVRSVFEYEQQKENTQNE